jgi:threonine/homoserine/homoserine lactone efflux protein
MGIENFLTFMAATLFFIMTPGLDTVFILNKSIGQGRKAGVYATLGINTGILVHTTFAALGLSLVIAKSVIAFTVLKYLGAAYLIYLGIAKIVSKDTILNTHAIKKATNTSKQNFVSGVVNNVLNPKVALFFLAFFPQFIKRESINSPVPFVILGATYAVMCVIWLLMLTLFASAFSKKLTDTPQAGKCINKLSGIAFILMGLKVAFTKR